MKITSAKIYLINIDARRPVLLQLFTDEGITGVGDAAVAYGLGNTAAAAMIKELVEKFLLGNDPFCIEAIWHQMYDHTFWAKGGGSIIFPAISAVETALWDIKGKALKVPVYEMLGGKIRDKARVYANGWSFRCLTLSDYARQAEKVLEDGYTALKLYPLSRPDGSGHGKLKHVSLRSIDRDGEKWVIDSVKTVSDTV